MMVLIFVSVLINFFLFSLLSLFFYCFCISVGRLMFIPTKLLLYNNLLRDVFSLWTVSPDEGQGPEGHNMAMGGASCTHTRPPTCWPPCRRSRPPASGRPQGKGVLRQMVQHVLLALFLGVGAAGQRLFSLFSSLFIFIFWVFPSTLRDTHTNLLFGP